jgi:hypothetical protein
MAKGYGQGMAKGYGQKEIINLLKNLLNVALKILF